MDAGLAQLQRRPADGRGDLRVRGVLADALMCNQPTARPVRRSGTSRAETLRLARIARQGCADKRGVYRDLARQACSPLHNPCMKKMLVVAASDRTGTRLGFACHRNTSLHPVRLNQVVGGGNG